MPKKNPLAAFLDGDIEENEDYSGKEARGDPDACTSTDDDEDADDGDRLGTEDELMKQCATQLERVTLRQEVQRAAAKRAQREKQLLARKKTPLGKKKLSLEFDTAKRQGEKRKRQIIASDDDEAEEDDEGLGSDTSVTLLLEIDDMTPTPTPPNTPVKKQKKKKKQTAEEEEEEDEEEEEEVKPAKKKKREDESEIIDLSAQGKEDNQSPIDFYLGAGWYISLGPVAFIQGGNQGTYEAVTITRGGLVVGGEKKKKDEKKEEQKKPMPMHFPVRMLKQMCVATKRLVAAQKNAPVLNTLAELIEVVSETSLIREGLQFTDLSSSYGRDLPHMRFKLDEYFYLASETAEYAKSRYDVLSFTRLPKLSKNKPFTLSMPACYVKRTYLCLAYFLKLKGIHME